MRNHVIIGAGISGLALGWFLKQIHGDKIRLIILEANKRSGGWIQTIVEKGFLFEQGPRSFRPEGAGIATLQLIEELNLHENVIHASPQAKKRFLYLEKKLQCLPTGLFSLLTSPFLGSVLKALWKDWITPAGQLKEESIYQFAERRFGKKMAEHFFDPMALGIYAGDIHQLSIQSCFPLLHAYEKAHGCVWKGPLKNNPKKEPISPFVDQARHKGLFTLKEGVQSLVDTLSDRLKHELQLNSEAKEIAIKDHHLHVHLQDGHTIHAEKLYLAVPPASLSKMLPQLSIDLSQKFSASVAVINLGYNKPVLKQEGFGYLVPSKEKQKLLGVVWDSSIFPQQNLQEGQTRLTAMMGGKHCISLERLSENELIESTLKQVHRQLGIGKIPSFIAIKKAFHAIPQYEVGHQSWLESTENAIKAFSPNITLLGNGYHGISVNECIQQAKVVAQGTIVLDSNTK